MAFRKRRGALPDYRLDELRLLGVVFGVKLEVVFLAWSVADPGGLVLFERWLFARLWYVSLIVFVTTLYRRQLFFTFFEKNY